ncbi:hypothetical protein BCR42DRAFT_426300 [Absidia repens]|uniref:F-box domain-containing protein n=1 Tax=Absidia repens TaxID=90262 RepID=A0A1X2I216_9FUNG|nr:hypothetical protein BCR42DRAFT_426300 [Absidia repens]
MIHHLPLEIISNIVEQLDDNKDRYSLALVNRFFYHETNPILWRSPTITSSSSTGDDNDDEEANTITAIRFIVGVMEARHLVALQVRKLDLGDYIWSDAELLLVTRRLSLLEELNINNGACLSNISLGCLPRHCPNLTSFRLADCHIDSPALFQAFGDEDACRHLQCLDLVNCAPLSPEIVVPLLTCPLKQLSLHLDYARWTTATATSTTIEKIVMDLPRLPHLTHLTLSNITDRFIQRLLTTASNTAAASWPHLVSFRLIRCLGMVGDTTLSGFLQTHRSLQHLTLSGGRFSDVVLVDTMARELPCLSTLDVSHTTTITAKGVHRLIWHGPSTLHWIQLVGCQVYRHQGQEMQHMDGDTVVDVVDPATASSTSKRRIPVDQLDYPAIMALRQTPNPDDLNDDNAFLVNPPFSQW